VGPGCSGCVWRLNLVQPGPRFQVQLNFRELLKLADM